MWGSVCTHNENSRDTDTHIYTHTYIHTHIRAPKNTGSFPFLYKQSRPPFLIKLPCMVCDYTKQQLSVEIWVWTLCYLFGNSFTNIIALYLHIYSSEGVAMPIWKLMFPEMKELELAPNSGSPGGNCDIFSSPQIFFKSRQMPLQHLNDTSPTTTWPKKPILSNGPVWDLRLYVHKTAKALKLHIKDRVSPRFTKISRNRNIFKQVSDIVKH